MTLLHPAWLTLLALGPLIVILHIRRPRRVRASSVVVWRRVAQVGGPADGSHGGSIDWPLVLQLAALLAVSLALARPTVGFDAGVDHRVYLLDASYGMLAMESGGRPLDQAVAWLDRELGGVPDTVAVTVVTAGQRPKALAVRTEGSGGAVRLDEIEVWATAAEWRSALDLVGGTLRADETTSLTVLTTRDSVNGWEEPLERSALASLETRVVTFGTSPFNAGLVGARVRPDASSPGYFVVEGSVAATEAVDDLQVVVERGDMATGAFQEVERLSVDVEPPAAAEFELALRLEERGSLRLSLVGGDAQPRDDVVTLPVGATLPRVLLVGEPAPELARVLTLLRDIEIYVADTLTGSAADFDLVIITDGDVTEVPMTSTLWLGSVPGGIAGVPRVSAPEVTTWSRHHVLATVGWAGLRIGEAYAGPLLPGATAVLSSGGVPLIQARTVDVGHQVVVSFPLESSNWAAQTSFPAFIAQLIDLVMPPERRGGFSACVAGESCRLGARFTEPRRGLVLADGTHWPPESAWIAGQDQFAEGHWALGGGELTFSPALPGVMRSTDETDDYYLPVVANPGWFIANGAKRDASEGSAEEGSALASRPAPSDPSAVLVIIFGVLVVANALLLWFRRVRWLGRRATWAHAATLVMLTALVASLLRVPLAQRQAIPARVSVVDLRSGSSQTLPVEAATVGITGIESASRSLTKDETMPGLTALDSSKGLELATSVAASNGAGSVVVYPLAGRGPTMVEVAEVARRAVGSGVIIDVVQPPVPGVAAVAIDAMHIPAGIAASTTVEALLSIEAAANQAGVLTAAFLDEILAQADVSLMAGANALRVPLRFDTAGSGRLTLTVAATDGTALATAETFVEVERAPIALIVGADPVAADTMASALELQGFGVDLQPPINVPWSLEGWSAWDLLVLLDVPAHALHSAQLEALEQWVGLRGGGLLLLGGAGSFGPGGYLRTPLDEMSPLSSQVPREAPEVTMLFVIDRSGSMQQIVGETTRMGIAKEATVAAMELLGPGSRVGVVVYDEEAQVLVPLTAVEQLEQVARAVGGVRANGGTALQPALLEAAEVLRGVESAAIHVVVLTDGMSQPAEFRSAIADLKALGATISFVGIGSGTDKIQLNDLAALAGGALHVTDDVRALPSILAQEALMASQDLVHRGQVEVVRHDPTGPLAQDLPAGGQVGGYVLTEAKPEAEVLLSTLEEEPAPLLAIWRYGLGRVVAFASQGAGQWTQNWLSGGAYPRAWGQFARWATATEVPSGADLSLIADGLSVVVTLHDLEEERSLASGRGYVAQIEGQGLAPRTVTLRETYPGTYESSLEVSVAGDYRVTVRKADGEIAEEGRVLVSGLGMRSSAASTEPAPILSLAALTGGGLVASGTLTSDAAELSVWSWEPVVGPWLVLALLGLLAYLVVVYGAPRWGDVEWAIRSLRGRLARRG